MKKLISAIIILSCLIIGIALIPSIEKNPYFSSPKPIDVPLAEPHNEQYMYNRAVMLYRMINKDEMAGCSGIQVQGSSGKNYILTAGHCFVLVDQHKKVSVKLDNGKKMKVRFIKLSKSSDLMLLEGIPNLDGISIAKSLIRHQNIDVYASGRLYKTYKVSGMFVQLKQISIYTLSGQFMTSVLSIPIPQGASGGAIVNKHKELVGIVSAGDQYFTYLVTLKDIKKFLINM